MPNKRHPRSKGRSLTPVGGIDMPPKVPDIQTDRPAVTGPKNISILLRCTDSTVVRNTFLAFIQKASSRAMTRHLSGDVDYRKSVKVLHVV